MKLFTVTTIRIDTETRVFQNTEYCGIMNTEELLEELSGNGCSDDTIETALNFGFEQTYIAESTIYTGVKKGTRFSYIYRIK